jgi:hypothetical protein
VSTEQKDRDKQFLNIYKCQKQRCGRRWLMRGAEGEESACQACFQHTQPFAVMTPEEAPCLS